MSRTYLAFSSTKHLPPGGCVEFVNFGRVWKSTIVLQQNRGKFGIDIPPKIMTQNLQSCRDCGAQVSVNAKSCPHCGCSNPTAKPIRLASFRNLAIAGAVLVALLIVVSQYQTATQPSATEAQFQELDAQGKEALKRIDEAAKRSQQK